MTDAVITGATEGLGYAYAKHLAENGFNLLLISRTKEKLVSVASELGMAVWYGCVMNRI